jgi:hypothetical protein
VTIQWQAGAGRPGRACPSPACGHVKVTVAAVLVARPGPAGPGRSHESAAAAWQARAGPAGAVTLCQAESAAVTVRHRRAVTVGNALSAPRLPRAATGGRRNLNLKEDWVT